MPARRPPLVVICGPTAAGKTALGVDVAAKLGGELVGADSMQVYRHLDIGTATPTPAELAGVPHHLLSYVDPDEPYDAARYARDADRAIAAIARRGRRPVVVGGSGLYLRVLLRGLQRGPAPDPKLRARLEARAAEAGTAALHGELARLDPEAAARLHPNDGVRILRALEVSLATGEPMTAWQRRHGFGERRYPALLLGVGRPREALRERIELRVARMIKAGFLDEVRGILGRGYADTLRPLQGLGYKRMCQHLRGELSLDEAVERTRSDTWRYSRRQRTWFNREPDLEWVPADAGEIRRRVEAFYAVEEARA